MKEQCIVEIMDVLRALTGPIEGRAIAEPRGVAEQIATVYERQLPSRAEIVDLLRGSLRSAVPLPSWVSESGIEGGDTVIQIDGDLDLCVLADALVERLS